MLRNVSRSAVDCFNCVSLTGTCDDSSKNAKQYTQLISGNALFHIQTVPHTLELCGLLPLGIEQLNQNSQGLSVLLKGTLPEIVWSFCHFPFLSVPFFFFFFFLQLLQGFELALPLWSQDCFSNFCPSFMARWPRLNAPRPLASYCLLATLAIAEFKLTRYAKNLLHDKNLRQPVTFPLCSLIQ